VLSPHRHEIKARGEDQEDPSSPAEAESAGTDMRVAVVVAENVPGIAEGSARSDSLACAHLS